MRQGPDNPDRNCVPRGVDEAELVRAIDASGYPLQGLVADKLKHTFTVTEEWGYIDRDSKEHRSLDVFAAKNLPVDKAASVRPRLVLLVECKRSVHPLVFFKNVTDRTIPGFPAIAGLNRGIVEIHDAKGGRFSEVKVAHALGLDKLPFIEGGPPICSAFSRAVLSGKKIELSGTELFNGLVLPLVKAFDHAKGLFKGWDRSDQLFPVLLLAIGVLDTPMILVESPHTASDPILVPWIRVVRQESNEDPHGWERSRFYGIDLVHIDYMDTFLSKQLMPFSDAFVDRTQRMAEILLKGGQVQDLDNWSWDQIQVRQK